MAGSDFRTEILIEMDEFRCTGYFLMDFDAFRGIVDFSDDISDKILGMLPIRGISNVI